MEMAKVMKCDVKECAYNMDNLCHTIAITIGDDTNPMCDTFYRSSSKGGDASSLACVGACKVSNCAHNKKLECQAPGITVSYTKQEADCMTFEQR
jgi:hypothetical protein